MQDICSPTVRMRCIDVGYCCEHNGSDEILVVTDFFNIEYPRVGENSNKISSDAAFVTRDVRSIVLGTVVRLRRLTLPPPALPRNIEHLSGAI
jgi:hypothetical protein